MCGRNPLWNEIDNDTYNRLCTCESIKEDIIPLAKSAYKYLRRKNPNYSGEDAVLFVFECFDTNDQSYLTYVDDEKFDEYVRQVEE